MISLDNNTASEILDHLLREKNQWRSLGGLFPCHRNNPQIYARDGRHIVIIAPFRVSPDLMLQAGEDPCFQSDFEDYLKQLKEGLEKHISAHRPRDLTMIISSGGSLLLPDWFMDWCNQFGFQVLFAPDPQEHPGQEEGVLDYCQKIHRLLALLEKPAPPLVGQVL